MTTPGGVPNLPMGALTVDNLASMVQDMSGTAMKNRAVERFPSIMGGSTGLDPALDITPFGILTRIWAEVNSLIANADPADIQGPEDLPPLVLEFIEGLPFVGELVGLLEAILGTYDGDDTVLLQVQEIFAPIRKLMQLVGGVGDGFPTLEELTDGWGNVAILSGGLLSGVGVPIGSITDAAPNLLPESKFVAGSIEANPQWTVDTTTSRSSDGSGAAKVIADGTAKALRSGTSPSDRIPVSPNQKVRQLIFVRHEGYSGSGAPIQLHVVPFNGLTQLEPVVLDTYAPAGPDLDWPGHELTGVYTVPASGVTSVQFRGYLDATALAGTIWWDEPEESKSGLLQKEWVDGLPDDLQELADFGQGIIDNFMNAWGFPGTNWGLPDLKALAQAIPGDSVIGAGGIPTVNQTFGTMWDLVTSALRLNELSGVPLDQLAAAAQDTSFSALNANVLAGAHEVTLGVRTNTPIDGALERTTISNFKVTELGTGATPTNFAVTQGASAIAIIRMPVADTKGIVYWRSMFTGTITGFFINFGKLNLDGTVSHLFQSPDRAADLTTLWSWDAYQVPDVNKIVHDHSENIVVEFVVVGSGTLSIAGQDFAWMTDSFPGATTKRLGASRNTAGAAPNLNLSAAAMNAMFTTKAPWVGLGRSDVPLNYHPPQVWQNTGAGAFAYPIPAFAQVAGNLIDWWAYGAGGGGQSGGYGAALEGGAAGQLVKGTFVYGVDIPLGTTQLVGNAADNAEGGLNPFILQPGDNGGPTTITGIAGGFTTKTALGGLGGGQSGNSWNQAGGQGAANGTTAGYQVFGGAAVGANSDGNDPGGGGGSGYPAVGRRGGEGRVVFRARQP